MGMVFVRTLRRMDVSIDAITKFSLNQFSGRYMLHLLARFTSYVNDADGQSSQFDIYVDRKRKGNTYDIEHILPDDYDSYKDEFVDSDDFQTCRQYIGDLIILTRDKNRSYQAMKYHEKVQKYSGDNILAQALNPIAYQNNPQFLPLAKQYGFEAIRNLQRKVSLTEQRYIFRWRLISGIRILSKSLQVDGMMRKRRISSRMISRKSSPWNIMREAGLML